MLSSAGIGSGLDVNSIVSSLMSIEQRPLALAQQKKSQTNVEISAWGQVKSAVSALQDAASALADTTGFGSFVASSSDEDVATAEVSIGYTEETHDITVIKLAEKHRLASDVYADMDAAVGEGTYSFTVDGETFDVTIDADNNSLGGLRDAINNAAGNTGVSASILNVDGGSRLVLTARESGTAGAITAPGMFTEIDAPVDAELEVDGFSVTTSSNNVSDIIPGLTLNLKSEGDVVISTTQDADGMQEKLNAFVDAYNSLTNLISNQREGTLGADSLMLGIQSSLRNTFFRGVEVEGESLSVFDMGLTFDKDGVLSVDSSKFTAAMNENSDIVKSFFTQEDTGFGNLVDDILDGYTTSGGLIEGRTDTLTDRISRYDDDIANIEYRLEKTEQRYYDEFTALDTLMAQLNSTSSYMTTQLAQISNLTIDNS